MQSVDININTSRKSRLLSSAATVSAVIPRDKQPFSRYYRSGRFEYRGEIRGYRGIPVVPITVQLSARKSNWTTIKINRNRWHWQAEELGECNSQTCTTWSTVYTARTHGAQAQIPLRRLPPKLPRPGKFRGSRRNGIWALTITRPMTLNSRQPSFVKSIDERSSIPDGSVKDDRVTVTSG